MCGWPGASPIVSTGAKQASVPSSSAVHSALDRARKANPDPEAWRRVGRWLAAGGDYWRKGKIDGRSLDAIDAWFAQSAAWDGRSPVVEQPGRNGVTVEPSRPQPPLVKGLYQPL